MGAPPETGARRPPRPRLRAAFTLACLLAGLVFAELAVRFLIFHPSETARRWGASMRDARNYANPILEDEFWRLRWVLGQGRAGTPLPPYDPLVGWLSEEIEPETYRLQPAPEARGRRPVLLYGASYAACLTPPEDCFPALMERSDLAADHYLLNYAVGGYGLDQVWLLMRESLDHFADQDPVVVVGLVVDTDYERSWLGFRDWPKPRLEIEDGLLVDGDPVSPSPEAYLEQHGAGIRSYAWRGLLHSSGLVPGPLRELLDGSPRIRRQQVELIEAILLAMRDELRRRELDHFFLVVSTPHRLIPEPTPRPPGALPDPEGTVIGLLEEHGIPYVNSRPRLTALEDIGLVFQVDGPGKNHPTPMGNRVLFETLRDGLEGRFTGGR